jgi:hypothetical protein
MPIQAAAANRSTTVDPVKWLDIFQRWCPAVPTAEHVSFINSWMEVAGPRRVEWLDTFIMQADNQERRPGTWKMNRLKQYEKAMREDANHLPRLRKLRGSPDFDVVLKILKTATRGKSANQILPVFRRHRAISFSGLVNLLVSMTRIDVIERYSDGIYGLPRPSGVRYESHQQQIFKLVLAVPETTRAALCTATGLSSPSVGGVIENLRKRGLIDQSRIAVSAGARAKAERGETIFNKKGKVFWSPKVSPAAPVDPAVFTVLRPDRPHVDPNEYLADMARLAALVDGPSAAELDAAARRWGRSPEEIFGLVKALSVDRAGVVPPPVNLELSPQVRECRDFLIEVASHHPEHSPIRIQPDLIGIAKWLFPGLSVRDFRYAQRLGEDVSKFLRQWRSARRPKKRIS